MTSKISRIITVTGLSAILTLSAIVPSFAGAEGRKNTAVALTALAVIAALSSNDNNRDRDYRYNDRYRSDYSRDYGYRIDVQRNKDNRYNSDNRRGNDYRFEANNSRDRGRFGSDQRKFDRKQPRGNAYGHDKRGRG